ncbi:TraY domain-containing protein [Pantoea sp. BAV 3049]|uniref:TraY domain-containing protein n=1 Tax=Pantoea sp. BAV 3049 TaxID=2654188 RepID=UPI00131D2153
MKTNKSKSDSDYVYITLRLDPVRNAALTTAARRSARSKRKEAELRLSLHLDNHEIIPTEELRSFSK